jgi:PadR family transcriptional regulator, regulatory protein AphA
VSSVRLTTTSYVVLGLVELCQPATPYELKQAAELTTSNFWTLAHTQLYSECSRLSAEGLLDEHQEEAGRRRKLYRLTDAGTEALGAWRAEPVSDFPELRDPGVLKLFFGAEIGPLARAQLETHRRQLALYEQLAEQEMAEPMRLALECGLGHEREYVRYWEALADRAS